MYTSILKTILPSEVQFVYNYFQHQVEMYLTRVTTFHHAIKHQNKIYFSAGNDNTPKLSKHHKIPVDFYMQTCLPVFSDLHYFHRFQDWDLEAYQTDQGA